MDRLEIQGGRPLVGRVTVSGAKNAALPILAASLLIDAPVELHRVPALGDVATMRTLLERLGTIAEPLGPGSWLLNQVDHARCRAPYQLVRKMRAGICVLGPLVARRGRGVVPLPGGCRLGDRPIDLHLHGLQALGAEIRIERGAIVATARRLRGATIHLRGPRGPSVTGTANILCAATLAHGTTILTGAALEPEVVDLGNFLIAAGARIEGLGTPRIRVDGVRSLGPAKWTLIPDRIETVTWLLAGCMTRGLVTVASCQPNHVGATLEALRAFGARVTIADDEITVDAAHGLPPGQLIATPYPGLPTDVQPLWAACLSLSPGRSSIGDTVFPERFGHVAELNRLGANLRRLDNQTLIDGVPSLSGAAVAAPDLRAGAALLLAGLAAAGRTELHGLRHLERGYENLVTKLRRLGGEVRLVRRERAPAPPPFGSDSVLD